MKTKRAAGLKRRARLYMKVIFSDCHLGATLRAEFCLMCEFSTTRGAKCFLLYPGATFRAELDVLGERRLAIWAGRS